MRAVGSSGELPLRRWVAGLAMFSASSALVGAAGLLASPRGNRWLPLELLRHVPFETFLVPGLLLGLVVGGTSSSCALLVWRRSRAAIDATVLAGGALTLWIVAEAAMLRAVHWLHLFYGALGVAMLALGAVGALRSPAPRHRWSVVVTAAEALGFAFPVLAGLGASALELGDGVQVVVLAAAGFIEGATCGAGQARAFPLPLRRARFSLLTGLGAATVWAAAMSFVHSVPALGPTAKVLAGALVAVIGLTALGGAQWLELRHHTPRAARWIAWTALAWVLALPMSFTPSPFVDESTPVSSQVPLWICAGMLMAYVMAQVTWLGVRRVGQLPTAARGN